MSGVDLGGIDGPMPDDVDPEAAAEEAAYWRSLYDRATPAERRSVIENRPLADVEAEEIEESLDPDERRARAAFANPDAVRDRDRPER